MLHASRNAFKNYLAFVNPGETAVSTIFHSEKMNGNYEEMTFCGCGELNPLENDPELKTIGIGTKVLINGAQGFVTGAGTRSSADNPNLTGLADMHQMDPQLLGGFTTGLKFDRSKCFNCGLCVSRCKGRSFLAHLGSIELEGVNHKVPVTLRQSDRVAALKATQDLKQQIQKGQFKMTEPVGKISFPGSP